MGNRTSRALPKHITQPIQSNSKPPFVKGDHPVKVDKVPDLRKESLGQPAALVNHQAESFNQPAALVNHQAESFNQPTESFNHQAESKRDNSRELDQHLRQLGSIEAISMKPFKEVSKVDVEKFNDRHYQEPATQSLAT